MDVGGQVKYATNLPIGYTFSSNYVGGNQTQAKLFKQPQLHIDHEVHLKTSFLEIKVQI